MLQSRRRGKVGAARIGDGGDAHTSLPFRQCGKSFQPLDAGNAERFGIGHDVCLRYRDEIFGTEIPADPHLVLDCPLPPGPRLARQHRAFFVGQTHATMMLTSG